MASEERDRAMQRIEAALVDQDRLGERFDAAVGTSTAFGAYVRLRGAGDQVTAREAWLDWVEDEGSTYTHLEASHARLEEPRASTTPDGRMVVRYGVEFELPDGRSQTVTAREEEHVPPAARVSPCPACASRAGTWPVPCACSTVSSTTATRAATTTRTSGAASPSSAPRRRALTGDCARTRRPPCGGTATRTGSPHLEEPERGRTS
jgi:hypothetical protein